MLRQQWQRSVAMSSILLVLGMFSFAVSVVMMTGCAKKSSEAITDTRDITAYLPVEGTVIAPASSSADIRSHYQIPLEKVYVTVGKSVSQGETLMLYSAPQKEAYYDQARFAVKNAQKSLDQAKRVFSQDVKTAQKQLAVSRSIEKKSKNFIARIFNPDNGESALNRQADEQAVIDAQARMNEGLVPYQQALVAAQEEFQAAQAGSKAAQVKSPISGTVVALNAKVGTVPDPKDGKPLITIVNLEALKVAAGVREDRLSLLKPKDPALVTIKEVPNVDFTGSLDEIYSEKAGFLRGQKYTALIDFKNTKGQAKPDMEANVSIKIGEVHNVLAVPANAVYAVDKQHAVKLKEGQEWHQRIVDIGLSDGKYTEIKSGLSKGDVVKTNP